MNMMRGGNRQMRRMMDKMGLDMEVPIFSEDDIMLVCQQANCDKEKAKDALAETKGDIAQAILRLTSG